MKAALTAAVGALALSMTSTATAVEVAPGPTVSVAYAAFAPSATVALVGDAVTWRNTSLRAHTVTAEDGSFDSGRLESGGGFATRADRVGPLLYYCRLHTFMRGEVDVRRVLLDAPREPAAPGRPYVLTGRAALDPGSEVRIQADAGEGFRDVGRAEVGTGGVLTATLTPSGTASYRAVAGAEESPAVQLLVLDRTVTAVAVTRARRATVWATVRPAAAGARLALQLRLRDHFGWWPVARARTGANGRARFRVPIGRRVPARVVLTLADGATRLATSPTVPIGH